MTLTWIQAIRQYQSNFFISYRYRNETDNWSNWTDREVNQEFTINSNFFGDNYQHYFLHGIEGHDSIQIRFLYNDNYYFWAIDDVKLVESKCNDSRIVPGKSAFAPFANIPADQVFPFVAGVDIFNAGACEMEGTKLNLKIWNDATLELVYDEKIDYDPIDPDSHAEFKFFPKPVDLPKQPADYTATYVLSFDSIDIFPDDNQMSYSFTVGGNVFSLEKGRTRSFNTHANPYGDPSSYTFGNYFRAISNAEVDYITWGVANPSQVPGETVNINLIQWTDKNNDQIAQRSERKIIGHNTYTFSGLENDTVLINTTIHNDIQFGEPVILEAGKGYMAMIEYNSSSVFGPDLNLIANDKVDYTQLQLSMDSAFSLGIVSDRVYFTVFGYSPAGISNIDYEVKELNPNDTRIFPGNDIIPLVRISFSSPDTTNTKSDLPSENLITVYPNPSSDEIYINMDFKKPYQHVQLKLVNNIGQTVFSKTLSGLVTNHIEPINVRHLASGNYMLQVETPDGQRSIPVMIAK
ncbi:MAG: T9SS type A sorting domain-containing protein [Saprospiraceae bacterium]